MVLLLSSTLFLVLLASRAIILSFPLLTKLDGANDALVMNGDILSSRNRRSSRGSIASLGLSATEPIWVFE
jgi:hypothetical protein